MLVFALLMPSLDYFCFPCLVRDRLRLFVSRVLSLFICCELFRNVQVPRRVVPTGHCDRISEQNLTGRLCTICIILERRL